MLIIGDCYFDPWIVFIILQFPFPSLVASYLIFEFLLCWIEIIKSSLGILMNMFILQSIETITDVSFLTPPTHVYLNIHWKDWRWSWNSNILATWC